MGKFILKSIDMSLDPASIDAAIKEIRTLRIELGKALSALAKELTEDGITTAMMNIMRMNAVDTGALEESIQGVYLPSEHLGVIFTNVPYALYVEYGTGVVGEANPHDLAAESGWEYDVNQHGDSGWWYLKSTDMGNRFRWTKGMPARPFMYETFRMLENEVRRHGGSRMIQYMP